jgi:hypothetical protein
VIQAASRAGTLHRAFLLVLGATAAVGLTPAIGSELTAQEDPTILKRRAWVDAESNRFKDNGQDHEVTLGGLWAWRVSDRQDWALRLKLPYKFHNAGDAPGDSDRQGFGDIKFATGTAFRLSEAWRTAVAVEMRFPTAGDRLGNDAWQLQLMGAAAWDATRTVTLSPSFEYNKSVSEKAGAAPQQFMEVFFPATFVLPQRWAVTARYETKVDYENGDRRTDSAKFVVTKLLEQLPLGFSFSIKKPLDGGNKRHQVNFVAVYYFR